MSADLTNLIFTDEAKAREHLEALRWPSGPFCPHCGEADNVTRLDGKAHRAGLFQCNSCRESFTVTVGTLFERSHVPLNKWMLAFHLMAASKKGMSAHQLHRMLDVTYKTAWFMEHLIREAMKDTPTTKLGGPGKAIEADETYWGVRPGAKRSGPGKKNTIVALVEREGDVRTFHVERATKKSVNAFLATRVDKASHLMTDDSAIYDKPGLQFARHTSVNHTAGEYVRDETHTNTVEGVFSIMKRGLIGTYHHVGVKHLQRYATEFGFRYNHRRVSDVERAESALRGITGKRLTYRRTDGGKASVA